MPDDFSMTFFTGRPGMGKTTCLAYQAFNNYCFMWDCNKCRTRFKAVGSIQCTNCGCIDRSKLRKVQVYSNFKLNFPFTPVRNLEEFEKMRHAFGAFDELWRWADARQSMTTVKIKGKKQQRNEIVSTILGTARKRHVEIGYTAQLKRQVDVRIREVTDTIARPHINRKTGICEIYFFDYYGIDYPFTLNNLIDIRKFRVEPIFSLFNTDEEIDQLDFGNELSVEDSESSIKNGAT